MHKYPEQQNGLAIVKKLAQARNRQEAFEAVSKEISASSPESLIDELARLLLNLRSALRAGTPQNKTGLLALIEASGEIARKKGIPLSRFYPVLLEKVLVEEAAEAVSLPSKPSAKERILEAALEIFSQKGFHPATTDEIAERAGVGKGTLYRYFETKDKLFAELVRLRLEELEIRAGSVMDGHDDVLTMISKYIRVYFEFFDGNQRLFRLIVQEQLELGEHSVEEYFRKVMRAIPHLKRKVYEGTQQGILKDVDFQTVFYGTMGFAHGVIQKWLARDCSYSLVDELPGVLEVLFYGFVKDAQKIE
ncbi:MAG: TetR/AcrR family transcriptional regulator [Syntrophobacteraceae bacterium]